MQRLHAIISSSYRVFPSHPLTSPHHPFYVLYLLSINIAQRLIRHSVHQLLDLHRREIRVDIHKLLHRDIITRRLVQNGVRAKHARPVRQIQVLPDPPHAVDLRMVHPEGRVAAADEGVRARVAADAEVAPEMHALGVLEGRVARVVVVPQIALDGRAEDLNVGRRQDQVGRVAERVLRRQHGRVEVALEAARVLGGRVGGGRVGRRAVVGQGDGAQVDLLPAKGSLGHAPGAAAGGKVRVAAVGPDGHRQTLVGNELAVAAERGVGAVEDGGLGDVLDVHSPFPVGESACKLQVSVEVWMTSDGWLLGCEVQCERTLVATGF